MAAKIVTTPPLGNLFSKFVVPRFLTQKTRLTKFCKSANLNNLNVNICKFSVNSVVLGSAGHAETTSTTQGLSKLQAQELILRLNGEERSVLMTALREYQSKLVKDEYEGQLAASRWRSKFGRPSKLPRLGDVDPTGSYCPFPEDWLLKKMGTTPVAVSGFY
ncbi:uncharacterized protein LOC108905131 [Anoplophora glabripennis]|uniref:uncharacterized protein LOC108905131 n=1 Tax=Anoplophora glabripennis TaxID=217634 RepID=UPI0008748BA4|nr:uncharacterized protein LOC108905131 [Anoplophora glabripennis]